MEQRLRASLARVAPSCLDWRTPGLRQMATLNLSLLSELKGRGRRANRAPPSSRPSLLCCSVRCSHAGNQRHKRPALRESRASSSCQDHRNLLTNSRRSILQARSERYQTRPFNSGTVSTWHNSLQSRPAKPTVLLNSILLEAATVVFRCNWAAVLRKQNRAQETAEELMSSETHGLRPGSLQVTQRHRHVSPLLTCGQFVGSAYQCRQRRTTRIVRPRSLRIGNAPCTAATQPRNREITTRLATEIAFRPPPDLVICWLITGVTGFMRQPG